MFIKLLCEAVLANAKHSKSDFSKSLSEAFLVQKCGQTWLTINWIRAELSGVPYKSINVHKLCDKNSQKWRSDSGTLIFHGLAININKLARVCLKTLDFHKNMIKRHHMASL